MNSLYVPIILKFHILIIVHGGQLQENQIQKTNSEIIIAADIPGAKKEDIDVSIINNILTIKGERKFEENINSEKSHIRERFYGSFERSFSLPEGMINKENVSAEMNNGELIVKLQKLAETQKDTRKINIK